MSAAWTMWAFGIRATRSWTGRVRSCSNLTYWAADQVIAGASMRAGRLHATRCLMTQARAGLAFVVFGRLTFVANERFWPQGETAHGDSGPRPRYLSRPSLDPHRLGERPRESDRAARRGPVEGCVFA